MARGHQALGRDHLDVARTKNNIALVLDKHTKYPEALQMHQEVFEVRLKTLGPNHSHVADSV